jgi:hypothetical protein
MKHQLKQLLNHPWFFPVLLFNYGWFCILFAEKYPANDGFGTDGYVYLTFVTDFIHSHFFDTYYIHRVLPSFVIRAILKLCSLELSPVNVFYSYEALNLISIVTAGYFIKKILVSFNVSLKNQLLAFVLLFVNFALLKWPFYFPVMTDTVTFTLSIMLLYYYLKNSSAGLVLITLTLAFTGPMAYYQGLILIALPYRKIEYRKMPAIGKWSLYGFSVLLFMLAFFYVIIISQKNTDLAFVLKIDQNLLWLSVFVLVIMYAAYAKLFMNAELFSLSCIHSSIVVLRLLAAIAVFAGVMLFISMMKVPETTIYPMIKILENPMVTALIKPFLTIVSHFTFFGVFFCLLIIFWNDFARILSTSGWGLIGAFALNLYLYGIMPESRTLMNLFPWALVFLIYAINNRVFSNAFYYIIAFLCFIVSRTWLPINLQTMNNVDENGSVDFPNQLFYMNLGPWMSLKALYINGLIMAICLIIIISVLYISRSFKFKEDLDNVV